MHVTSWYLYVDQGLSCICSYFNTSLRYVTVLMNEMLLMSTLFALIQNKTQYYFLVLISQSIISHLWNALA